MATNPLTPEQIAELREIQRLIPQHKEAIKKAKLAGIDVTAQEKQLLEQEKSLNLILQNYG